MKPYRLYPAVFATAVALASLANAQETSTEAKPDEPPGISAELEERYRQMAEQLKQGPPKRELEVKSVRAVKTKLFQVDPKVLENKFVAQFELRRFRRSPANRSGGLSMNAIRSEAAKLLDEQSMVVQAKAWVERSPAEHRPDQPMIDFLTSKDCDRDVRRSVMAGGSGLQLMFQVFAPTAEEAERRARAIIQLHDAGYSRPVQQEVLQIGQKAMDQARSQLAEIAKLQPAAAAVAAKLDKPSEISNDILSQLKAQKVMVAIELAGLSARVKACDAMLSQPMKLEPATLQSVSDMKVKAEIERVGIKEKLDQINTFIAEGNERQAIAYRRQDLWGQLEGARNGFRSSEASAGQLAELFAYYAPFDVPENQIAIGPIEWTQ